MSTQTETPDPPYDRIFVKLQSSSVEDDGDHRCESRVPSTKRQKTSRVHKSVPPPSTSNSNSIVRVPPQSSSSSYARSRTHKERILLERLEREYTPQILRNVLLPLVTQTSPVSLRALDWAVVNWSKKHNVICSSTVPGRMTNIHHDYSTTLSFWKRLLFDPFRRRSRIGVRIDGALYETTLGQANFALWTYKTGVLAYVLSHLDDIEDDMNQVSRRQKRERNEAAKRGLRRKRSQLIRVADSCCVAYASPSIVVFD